MNTEKPVITRQQENIALLLIILSFIGLASSLYLPIVKISLASHPLLEMLLPEILLSGYAVFGIIGYVALAFTFVFLAESIREKIYGTARTEFTKNNQKKLIGYGSVFLWMAALLMGAGNTYIEFENVLSKLNMMNSGQFRPDFIASLRPETGLRVFCIALATLFCGIVLQNRIVSAKENTMAKRDPTIHHG